MKTGMDAYLENRYGNIGFNPNTTIEELQEHLKEIHRILCNWSLEGFNHNSEYAIEIYESQGKTNDLLYGHRWNKTDADIICDLLVEADTR